MERKKVSDKNGSANERWLWHGLNPDVLDSVLVDGFNTSYASLENNMYGVYMQVEQMLLSSLWQCLHVCIVSSSRVQ